MKSRHSFIGAGWHWPVQLDAAGRVSMVTGTTDLEQAMYLVLSTTPGERPMRPEFGCRLAQFVFAPANASTAGLISAEVRAALARWEPRVVVTDVVVSADPDDASTLWIDVVYLVRATNDRRNLVVPFYVIGEHEAPTSAPAELLPGGAA